ncbi:GTP cyclohydrolase 1 [Hibiscus syriacus]|uniref:GTP cyclohydrolase 1 n=1 Tax=Hibiscus syriacus TaxID=106335 RepID=A0A6A2YRT5_HIBSY|nr:GTP cyclohydrolase 1 [Hibiscus syriacus]
MGLGECHFCIELENGTEMGGNDLGLEEEPKTMAIEDAVKVLLQSLGEDINREGIKKTPLRVAKALREGTRGYKQKVKDIVQGALFPEVGLHDEVGYVPSGERVVGLSKLSRVADVFAKRLQDPQRLADEICSALHLGINPAGVAVVLQCLHIHFPNLDSVSHDSNHQGWIKVHVSSSSGVFENENALAWGDFMGLLKFRGVKVEKIPTRDCRTKSWCPSYCSSELVAANPGMVAAVASILRSLGEDPSRKELLQTPGHFVNWLMNFQNTKLNGFPCGTKPLVKSAGEFSDNHQQMHSELNLAFWSQCEHHLLPFHGVVHIGYMCPEGCNPIEKCLLQSIVHYYGFKLQVQERLSRQIAETVSSITGGDTMVVVEAYHTCMISRGIEKFGSNTATIAVTGRFSTDSADRAMFLDRIPNIAAPGVVVTT